MSVGILVPFSSVALYMSTNTLTSNIKTDETKLTLDALRVLVSLLVHSISLLCDTELKRTKTPTDILKALETFLTNPFKLKLVWAPYGNIMKQ